MMNKYLAELCNFKQAFNPVDLDAAAATGARVALKAGQKLSVIIQMGDSTAAVVTPSFQQHDAASGGNSKALSIANNYYKKAGSDTSFTKVEVDTAASSFALAADFASQEGIVIFEINTEDLDVNNGFNHVSVNLADTTAAKIGAALYVVSDLRNQPGYSQDI